MQNLNQIFFRLRTERSMTGPVPSRITGCPTGYMDCGSCLCVPSTTCDSCLVAVPNLPNPAPAPAPAPSNGEPVPSTIRGCPAGYVDCGGCFCTPRSTCDACNVTGPPTLWPGLPGTNGTNGSNGSNETNATVPHLNFTPSRVPQCPRGYVDCGTCLCVSVGTCAYCPGAWVPAPPVSSPGGVVPVHSRVPGCPANYYDCGTCQCVPHSTCQWCPAGGGGSVPFPGRPVPGPAPAPPATPVHSRVPGCPANYYDCGTCQCVPHSTCQWCPAGGGGSVPFPGRPVPGPAPAPPATPVHSRVPGCPADYYDCGTCQCVPHSTCQWCPAGGGGSVPFPGRPVPGPAPAPPATPVHSRVPGCPANYYDCGTCQCVPHSTCQWCPAGGGSAPAPAPAPGNPGNPTPPRGAVPSTIVGCPANYYDCGSCRCVPGSTCQWCGGISFVASTNSSDDDRPLRI